MVHTFTKYKNHQGIKSISILT